MEPVFYYYVAVVVFVVLFLWLLALEIRLKKLFRGAKARDIESIILAIKDELKKLDVSREQTGTYLETVEKRLKRSIQSINTIRFNPFEDAGSNQSFSTAFLDEKGDGVVISSLYSREGVRVYAKPIQEYKSEYSLSEEEKEAISAAV